MRNQKMYCVDIGVFVCVTLLIASIHCDGCANRVCAQIPKHYEELGCKKIGDNEACCATRFDCPDFAKYDSSMCHLRGKKYNVSDALGANDAPNYLASCKCTIVGDQPAAFDCAIVECPEDFGADYCSEDCSPSHGSSSCISIYENVTSLCRTKEICDEIEIANLPMCYDGDKVYHSGEKFEPASHPCHECICNADFENATAVADNVNCAEIDCGIAIREAKHIRDGCAPVYYGRDRCCPIEFRCPSNDDQIMDSNVKSAINGSIDTTCTFGNTTLHIDQQLKTTDKCTECKCTMPPMITCTQLTDCSGQ